MDSTSAHTESIRRDDMWQSWQRSWGYPMKRRLEMELDFVTDLPPLEFASKITPLVREAIESVKQALGSELEFDIFLILDGREVRLVMEPVWRIVILDFTFYWYWSLDNSYSVQVAFPKANVFSLKKYYTFRNFFYAENRKENADKPTQLLDSQAILKSYQEYEKSYQMVTFQKIS